MDISGLSSVTTAAEMVTWLTDNCVTPIRPSMSGEDFAAILEKVIAVAGSSEDQLVSYLKSLPGYVGDGSRFLADDLNWHSTAILELAPPSPVLVITGPTSVSITWLPVQGAVTYTVERALDAGFTNTVTTVYTGYGLSFSDTGLVAGTQYFYRVKAVAPHLPDSAWSATVSNAAGNIFYGYVNNQWNNPNNWSASTIPISTDLVVIAANCNLNVSATVATLTINNGISLSHTVAGNSLTVNSNFINNGTYNCNLSGSYLILNGTGSSYVWGTANFGNYGTVKFEMTDGIQLPNWNYWAIYINDAVISTNIKWFASSGTLEFAGPVSIGSQVRFDSTNIIFDSNFFMNSGAGGGSPYNGCVIQTMGGKITFKSQYIQNLYGGVNLTGNPDIEFQNGISGFGNQSYAYYTNTGTGTIYFTTNNQTVNSNSGQNGTLNLNHNVIINNVTVTINNTYGNNTLLGYVNGTTAASTLIINSNVQYYDTSSTPPMSTGQIHFTGGVFFYSASANQTVWNLSYYYLGTAGSGIKTVTAGVSVPLLYLTGGTLEMNAYSLSVTTTAYFTGGSLDSSGVVTLYSTSHSTTGAITGTSAIEIKNGMVISGNGAGTFTLNANSLLFSTNNQIIGNSTSNVSFVINAATLTIASGITLINANGIGSILSPRYVQLNYNIQGTDATSKLINTGALYLNFVGLPMSAYGTFDITAAGNYVVYVYAGNQSIPNITYQGLGVGGSGTKTLSANLNVGYVYTLGSVTFDWGTYNINVSTGATFNSGTTIQSQAAGYYTFLGPVTCAAIPNFTAYNPTFEFHNGLVYSTYRSRTNDWGTGIMKFTGNNQTLDLSQTAASTNGTHQIYNQVIIDNITLSVLGNTQGLAYLACASLNGTTSTSTLTIPNAQTVYIITDATDWMTTGVVSLPTGSTVGFGSSATSGTNLPIPVWNYYNLSCNYYGTFTTLGNLVINGALSLGSYSTGSSSSNQKLTLGSYNLTVYGTTTANGYIFVETPGSSVNQILFVGAVSITNAVQINFNANTQVEFRNGFSMDSTCYLLASAGSWKFTTNNQSCVFAPVASGSNVATQNIIVGSGITLTVNGGSYGFVSYYFTAIDATSILKLGSNVAYDGGTTPMDGATINTNGYTFSYPNGNQNVKGGTYDKLTLSGGGTKTLQGNVIVTTTYTLVGGTTLDLNGYTLTHP